MVIQLLLTQSRGTATCTREEAFCFSKYQGRATGWQQVSGLAPANPARTRSGQLRPVHTNERQSTLRTHNGGYPGNSPSRADDDVMGLLAEASFPRRRR